MLSTSKVRTSSWRYYAQQVGHGACEYFLGVGEAPGRWYGRGLEGLGLETRGEVRDWQLEATFGRAIHPAAKVQLGRAWRADGVTGYDLCFSAPKSVSALWALGGSDVGIEVARAHAAAVRAGLDYLDAHAAFSRVGRNGHTQVSTDGMAAAVFDHRTSRAGDPQLHTHALVLNKLRCPDGEWRTIDGHEIYAHKKSAGVLYQAALRSELTRRLGVTWTEVTKDGQAEIVGVPGTLVEQWSTRAKQVVAESAPVIAAYERELGRPLTSAERSAVSKVAVLKTRPGKEQVDIIGLLDRWHTEAAALGWTPEAITGAVRDAAADLPVAAPDVERLVLDAVVAAGARKAIFSRSDLVAEVAARIPCGSAVNAVTVLDWAQRLTDRALRTSEAVGLLPEHDGPVRASDARYASAATLNQELEILRFADADIGAGVATCRAPVVAEACARRGLDETQTAAVARIVLSGDQLSVLVAPAGTGKTTTLAAMVDAWRFTGRDILALAPSARAAKELAAATGLPAETVAKYLHENQQPQVAPRYRLQFGTVVIVDETSMLSTRDLYQLRHDVEITGGKLLLVGDPAQISPIDAAGGMLPALAERLDAPSLNTVHRLRAPWERAASLQLRAGDPACITSYLDHDRVHVVDSQTDPYEQVFSEYQRSTAGGADVLLLARGHDDVDQLNERARAYAIQTGAIRVDPLLTVGGRDWRTGDRLRVTRNDRRIPVGADHLRNGDVFNVITGNEQGLTVQRLHSPDLAVLPRDYLARHATYGWASTVDAAQGATVDHSLLLARPGLDRTRLYVAMTRGRQTNHVYLAPEPEPEITPRTGQPRTVDPAEQLAQILSRTGETAAPHTRLPEPVQSAAPSRPRTQPRTFAARRAMLPRRDDDHRYLVADHERYLNREHDRGYGRSR